MTPHPTSIDLRTSGSPVARLRARSRFLRVSLYPRLRPWSARPMPPTHRLAGPAEGSVARGRWVDSAPLHPLPQGWRGRISPRRVALVARLGRHRPGPQRRPPPPVPRAAAGTRLNTFAEDRGTRPHRTIPITNRRNHLVVHDPTPCRRDAIRLPPGGGPGGQGAAAAGGALRRPPGASHPPPHGGRGRRAGRQ